MKVLTFSDPFCVPITYGIGIGYVKYNNAKIMRQCVIDLRAALEARDEEIKRLREAGRAAANVCYNLSQSDNLIESHRKSARWAVDAWGAALAGKGPDDDR